MSWSLVTKIHRNERHDGLGARDWDVVGSLGEWDSQY